MNNEVQVPGACFEAALIKDHIAGAGGHQYASPEDTAMVSVAGCVDGLILKDMTFVFEQNIHGSPFVSCAAFTWAAGHSTERGQRFHRFNTYKEKARDRDTLSLRAFTDDDGAEAPYS